jgi:hypothetical protein
MLQLLMKRQNWKPESPVKGLQGLNVCGVLHSSVWTWNENRAITTSCGKMERFGDSLDLVLQVSAGYARQAPTTNYLFF